MQPCYSCQTAPHLINDQHGLMYQCPKCSVRAKPSHSLEAAEMDWNALNDRSAKNLAHGIPVQEKRTFAQGLRLIYEDAWKV